MFDLGQQVVCIEKESDGRSNGYMGPVPVEGQVYTIENIYRASDETLMLELVELPSPRDEMWDAGFCASCFRPVRKTSIEVFTKLLAPLPRQKELA